MLDTQEFEKAAELTVDILDAVDKHFIINSADGGLRINLGLVDLVVLNVYIALMDRVPGFNPNELIEGLHKIDTLGDLPKISESLWNGVLLKREKLNADS
jgi:hypothetical protein